MTPRQITLGETPLAYRLRRSARRSIGLTVDAAGLAVAAPQRAPIDDIEAVIRQHAAWVLRKLDEWRSRPPPLPAPVIGDGSRVAFLGGELLLRVCVGRGRAQWDDLPTKDDDLAEETCAAAGLAQSAPLQTLTLYCREASEGAVAKALKAALCERARPLFTQRLAHYCARLGVTPPALTLSSARTRWGSCSPSGIRLNWRLLQLPPTLVDYVVAHEVSHLLEMNHSPRFWSVVERLYPGWRAARAELRQRAAHCLP
ncbi:M48 family metallopeptidase [Rhodocyclus tenuis]|uniref:M48 family metallopeptidase n=1 Tax=Rhodocyclus tenuis TaxID=1066 RepID=UPI001907FD13|nr:SprT family zinc-dependent metalloprotease [Rhodocyclus tenuis]MBK1681326.1 hypothetical protein [Rhodocyclus tenuis]